MHAYIYMKTRTTCVSTTCKSLLKASDTTHTYIHTYVHIIPRIHTYIHIRTHTQVHPERFYNPVTSLLTASEGGDGWKRMKTVGELRRETGKPYHVNKDSLYKPIERAPRKFNPLKVCCCMYTSMV